MPRELRDIEPLRRLLGYTPLGLISDIDGTLSPIVPDPDSARVTDLCLQRLGELVQRGVRVALVTGRTLEKARAMAPLDGVAFAANHGLDLWVDGRRETPPDVREYVPLAGRVLHEMGNPEVQGLTVEQKGPGLAFHYRNSADRSAARRAILAAIAS